MKTLYIRLLLLLLMFSSCSSEDRAARMNDRQRWFEQNGKIKVLSTIAMISNLVEEVGGDKIDSLTLIKGELDPHSYQLVKGDDEKLAFADLIFYNGLGLEHGPSLQKHLHNNTKALALGDAISTRHPKRILQYQGQLDPHIWMDVSLWMETVPFIVETLSKKDPENASTYYSNGEKLIAKMIETDGQVRNEMIQIPENMRYLVTTHDAFNYFARAYLATDAERQKGGWQKRFAAPEGLAPDSQLSAVNIQSIIDYLRKYDIHVLFPESNISKDSIRKILDAGREKGLHLHISKAYIYGDAMGRPGTEGDTYLKMMLYNAKTIRKTLMDKQE